MTSTGTPAAASSDLPDTVVRAGTTATYAAFIAHLFSVAVVIAVVVPRTGQGFLPDEATGPTGHPNRHRTALAAWTEPRTLLIGLFVLAFAFAEGAGNDWIGVAVIDGYHLPAALGTLAFAGFLTAMTVGRWCGPALLDRYGRVPVVRLLALIGCCSSSRQPPRWPSSGHCSGAQGSPWASRSA